MTVCVSAALAVVLGVAPGGVEEIKVGAVGTLSGGGTEWGLALQRGMTVAVDEINAAGGVKVGGKTHTIKMIMYDDQYTAQGGTTAATRLVNVDGVKFTLPRARFAARLKQMYSYFPVLQDRPAQLAGSLSGGEQ